MVEISPRVPEDSIFAEPHGPYKSYRIPSPSELYVREVQATHAAKVLVLKKRITFLKDELATKLKKTGETPETLFMKVQIRRARSSLWQTQQRFRSLRHTWNAPPSSRYGGIAFAVCLAALAYMYATTHKDPLDILWNALSPYPDLPRELLNSENFSGEHNLAWATSGPEVRIAVEKTGGVDFSPGLKISVSGPPTHKPSWFVLTKYFDPPIMRHIGFGMVMRSPWPENIYRTAVYATLPLDDMVARPCVYHYTDKYLTPFLLDTKSGSKWIHSTGLAQGFPFAWAFSGLQLDLEDRQYLLATAADNQLSVQGLEIPVAPADPKVKCCVSLWVEFTANQAFVMNLDSILVIAYGPLLPPSSMPLGPGMAWTDRDLRYYRQVQAGMWGLVSKLEKLKSLGAERSKIADLQKQMAETRIILDQIEDERGGPPPKTEI